MATIHQMLSLSVEALAQVLLWSMDILTVGSPIGPTLCWVLAARRKTGPHLALENLSDVREFDRSYRASWYHDLCCNRTGTVYGHVKGDTLYPSLTLFMALFCPCKRGEYAQLPESDKDGSPLDGDTLNLFLSLWRYP